MKTNYSVEVDRYNPMALAHCLKKLEDNIPNFENDWILTINAGGIDYGVYLNINVEKKEIEICNQPEYGSDGDDSLDDIITYLEEEEDEEEDEEESE